VFYGTDTRAQSLLVGALLAMLLIQRGPVLSIPGRLMLQGGAVVCVAFVGFVWARAGDDSALLYRGGFLVLGMAVAVVIAASVQPGASVVGRVLSLPPLRGLGLISYGVYLWHWPVYLMLTPGRVGWNDYPLLAWPRRLPSLSPPITSWRCRYDAAPSSAGRLRGRLRRRPPDASRWRWSW
jgi:peptidoglycan/LPS O-acetylase OafA/YrhL